MKHILITTIAVFLLLSLIPQQILAQVSGSLEIVNVTKDTVIFSDDFESGTTGEAPEADDPKVGTWNWNDTPVTEIRGLENTKKMIAAEGSQYLKVARMSSRVKLTAVGDDDAAIEGEEGDTVEIRFSFFYESGYASIYPGSIDGDSAQITFFPGGEVRIYGGADVGWNILDQTYNEGDWNEVVIQYINDSGEHSISVNGAEFETYEGVSSEDNGSGGNLDGFRLQGDGGNTIFYLDGIQGTEHEPIKLKYTNFGGVAFKAIEGKDYEIQVSHDLKQWSELGEIKDASGDVEFIDPRQPLVPFKKNFFRVKLVE